MAEYIKRTEVMKICREYSKHCFNSNDAYGQDIADRIENDVVALPTADVVEVVRCKDCEYWNNGYCEGIPFCGDYASFILTEENDFCSYGKRKEGAADGR